jgi:hypothetical protein
MPKKLLATIITILLAVEILLSASIVRANFIPTHSELFLTSPIISSIKLYQNESVPIEVDVKVPPDAPSHYPKIEHIYYSLDEKQSVEMTNVTHAEEPWFHGICINYHASDVIAKLTDGNHSLQVYCVDDAGKSLSDHIEFAYSNDYKTAQLSMLSPLNMTYPITDNLPLTFNTNTPFVIGNYVLDNTSSKPITIRDNSTLTELIEGTHQLVLTVWTTVGKTTQTTFFQISNDTNPSSINQKSNLDSSSNSLSLYVPALGLAIIAVASISLVYFKRRKKIVVK